MRFLKTFFRFFTIVMICSTFTGGAFGNAVESAISGLSCDYNQKASCIAVNGCAYYPNNDRCGTSFCNNNGRWNCNEQAGCYNNTGSMGSENCKVCPAGKCCPEETNVNEKDPKTCEAGYYCEAGSGDCRHKVCTKGHYCPSGSSSPTPCPGGTYRETTGGTSESSCAKCSAGTYSAAGASSCTTCTAGYYCPDTKTRTICPQNSFCGAGVTEPTSCFDATDHVYNNTDAAGKASIADCYKTVSPGQYWKSDHLEKCESGFYCEGERIYYGYTETTNAGRHQCPTSSFAVSSPQGAKAKTECYITCPREELSSGNGYYPATTQTYKDKDGFIQDGYPACRAATTLPTCYPGYHLGYSDEGQMINDCYGYEYLVMFHKNQPSGASATATPASNQYSQTLTYGSSAVALTDNKYALKGWTFTGWNTAANGTGTSYTNKQLVQNLITPTADDQQFNLYAQWQANTYTVTYNSNPPSASAGTISGGTASSTHTYDKARALTANGYSLTGWTFTGWNTAQNGSGTSYTDKASVKNLTDANNGTITLYAQWAPNTYKVTLDKQGATGGTSEYWYQYETHNPCYYYNSSTISSSTCLNGSPGDKIVIPTKSKFVYQGYFTGSNGSGTQYVQTNGNMINNLYKTNVGNITLFAKMTACACTKGTGVASCTITGTTDNKCQYSVSCSSGYTKDGTNGGATLFNTEGAVATDSYTAQCSAKSFTIYFHNDYYDNKVTDFSFNVTYDANLPVITGQTKPTRQGYVFAGYYDTESTGGTLYYNADMSAVSGKKWTTDGGANLYARWTPCKDNHYCIGDNTETKCPSVFIYTKSDFNYAPADEITDCYLNPGLTLKDSINEGGVKLNTLPGSANKIFYVGS